MNGEIGEEREKPAKHEIWKASCTSPHCLQIEGERDVRVCTQGASKVAVVRQGFVHL